MTKKLKLVEEVLGQRLRAVPGQELAPAPDLQRFVDDDAQIALPMFPDVTAPPRAA